MTSISKRTGLLRGSEQSAALDLGEMEDQFFSDDDSFEEQFQEDGEILITVMAPAGKLGMVIDTPSGGKLKLAHCCLSSRTTWTSVISFFLVLCFTH